MEERGREREGETERRRETEQERGPLQVFPLRSAADGDRTSHAAV